MTIEQAIVERLKDQASVTALVGTRIYQLVLPQRPTLPAVRVQVIDEDDPQHLRGPVGKQQSRIQVDAYGAEAAGYVAVAAIAAAIHGDGLGGSATGLSGFVGDVGGSPAEIHIAAVQRLTRSPMYEAGELRLVRIRQDYRVTWAEI